MCDDLHQDFSECYDQVLKESEEKAAICSEIDDLRERCNQQIQSREVEKQRMPSVNGNKIIFIIFSSLD